MDYPPEFGPRTPTISEEEIAAIRKTLVAKRVMIFIGCVAVAALMVSMVFGIWLIRSTQTNSHSYVVSGARAAKAAHRGTSRIIDCTTPGRPCYDRGQQRLARTVAGLSIGQQRSAAASAACAVSLAQAGRTLSFKAVYRCELLSLSPPPRKH